VGCCLIALGAARHSQRHNYDTDAPRPSHHERSPHETLYERVRRLDV
jgi:hypothetical protein